MELQSIQARNIYLLHAVSYSLVLSCCYIRHRGVRWDNLDVEAIGVLKKVILNQTSIRHTGFGCSYQPIHDFSLFQPRRLTIYFLLCKMPLTLGRVSTPCFEAVHPAEVSHAPTEQPILWPWPAANLTGYLLRSCSFFQTVLGKLIKNCKYQEFKKFLNPASTPPALRVPTRVKSLDFDLGPFCRFERFNSASRRSFFAFSWRYRSSRARSCSLQVSFWSTRSFNCSSIRSVAALSLSLERLTVYHKHRDQPYVVKRLCIGYNVFNYKLLSTIVNLSIWEAILVAIKPYMISFSSWIWSFTLFSIVSQTFSCVSFIWCYSCHGDNWILLFVLLVKYPLLRMFTLIIVFVQVDFMVELQLNRIVFEIYFSIYIELVSMNEA